MKRLYYNFVERQKKNKHDKWVYSQLQFFELFENNSSSSLLLSTEFAALILVLTVYTLKANAQVNPECNFSQRLDADKKYTIYNPGYPAPYSGQNYCRWVARARLGYKVTLECQDFYIPEVLSVTNL